MPTSNIKVSVIIPVYNCEAYLEQCLDSVARQTLKEIEIIVINDCSTDNSCTIIEKYSTEDMRIVPISLEQNMGVSVARNSGIEKATGEYIIFLDADDYWLSENLLEILHLRAQTDKTDMVRFGISRIGLDGSSTEHKFHDKRIIDFNHDKGWRVTYNITAVLVLKQLIDQKAIRFSPGLAMGEDALFSCELYSKALAMSICELTGYAYRANPSGANFSPWDRNKVFCTFYWANMAVDMLGKDSADSRHIKIIWQIIGERLNMLSDRLLKLAYFKLSKCDFEQYVNNWSELFSRTLGNDTEQAYFMSNLPVRHRQLHSLITAGDIESIINHINSSGVLIEQTDNALRVTFTQQKAREIGQLLINTDKSSVTLDLGSGVSKILSREKANQLARRLIENNHARITVNFDNNF